MQRVLQHLVVSASLYLDRRHDTFNSIESQLLRCNPPACGLAFWDNNLFVRKQMRFYCFLFLLFLLIVPRPPSERMNLGVQAQNSSHFYFLSFFLSIQPRRIKKRALKALAGCHQISLWNTKLKVTFSTCTIREQQLGIGKSVLMCKLEFEEKKGGRKARSESLIS